MNVRRERPNGFKHVVAVATIIWRFSHASTEHGGKAFDYRLYDVRIHSGTMLAINTLNGLDEWPTALIFHRAIYNLYMIV